jgi:multiple sugar transport system ATP-binding protein
LRVELKRLHTALGDTTIYVTHDQVEAMTLADRIAVMKDGIIQQLAAPEEIYQRHNNQYVACFIGSPTMNFVDGSIEVENGTAFFAACSFLLVFTNYSFAQKPASGPAILGVRAENIRICAADTPGAQQGTVDFVETLGADTVVWVTAGNARVAIRAEGTRKFV